MSTAKKKLLTLGELADHLGVLRSEVFAAVRALGVRPELYLGGIDRYDADAIGAQVLAAIDHPARHASPGNPPALTTT